MGDSNYNTDIYNTDILRYLWKKFNSKSAFFGSTNPVTNEPKFFENSISISNVTSKIVPKELNRTINENINIYSINDNTIIYTILSNDLNTKLDSTPPQSIQTNDLYSFIKDNYSDLKNGYINLNSINSKYTHLKLYIRLKLTTNKTLNIQQNTGNIYSWSQVYPIINNNIPIQINNLSKDSILKNTIPDKFNTNGTTYIQKLEILDPYFANYFHPINYFSQNQGYYSFDPKNGLLHFNDNINVETDPPYAQSISLGGVSTGLILNKDSELYYSFVKYIGPTGFDNAELSGNIIIDGSLNIFNGNLNISGGDIFIDSSNIYDIFQTKTESFSLNPWSDLSLTNLDISSAGRISIFNSESYTDISDISNIVLTNLQVQELVNYYISDLSYVIYNDLSGKIHTNITDISDLSSVIYNDLSGKIHTNITDISDLSSVIYSDLSGKIHTNITDISDLSYVIYNDLSGKIHTNITDINNLLDVCHNFLFGNTYFSSTQLFIKNNLNTDISSSRIITDWIEASDYYIDFTPSLQNSFGILKAKIFYQTAPIIGTLISIKIKKFEITETDTITLNLINDSLVIHENLGGNQLFTNFKNDYYVDFFDTNIEFGKSYRYKFYYRLSSVPSINSLDISFGFGNFIEDISNLNFILFREIKYDYSDICTNTGSYEFNNNLDNNFKLIDNNFIVKEKFKINFPSNYSDNFPNVFQETSYNIIFHPNDIRNNLLLDYNIYYSNAYQSGEIISFKIVRHIKNDNSLKDISEVIILDNSLNSFLANAEFRNIYSIFYIDELSKIEDLSINDYLEYKLLFNIDNSSSPVPEGLLENSGNLINIKELKSLAHNFAPNLDGIYINNNIFKNYNFSNNLGSDLSNVPNILIPANRYNITHNLENINNNILLKFKVNFTCNNNSNETIKFVVKRIKYLSPDISQQIAVSQFGSSEFAGGPFNNIFNIEIIDKPNYLDKFKYQLYYQLESSTGSLITPPYGIIDDNSSNFIFLQEFIDLSNGDEFPDVNYSLNLRGVNADNIYSHNIENTLFKNDNLITSIYADISNVITTTLKTNNLNINNSIINLGFDYIPTISFDTGIFFKTPKTDSQNIFEGSNNEFTIEFKNVSIDVTPTSEIAIEYFELNVGSNTYTNDYRRSPFPLEQISKSQSFNTFIATPNFVLSGKNSSAIFEIQNLDFCNNEILQFNIKYRYSNGINYGILEINIYHNSNLYYTTTNRIDYPIGYQANIRWNLYDINDPMWINFTSNNIYYHYNTTSSFFGNINSSSEYYNKFVIIKDVSLVNNRIDVSSSNLGNLLINDLETTTLQTNDISVNNKIVLGSNSSNLITFENLRNSKILSIDASETHIQNLQANDVSFTNLDISNSLKANDVSFTNLDISYILNLTNTCGENTVLHVASGKSSLQSLKATDVSFNNLDISNSLILDISNKQPNVFDIYSQPQSINVTSVENSQQFITINIQKFRQYKIPILNNDTLYPIIDGIKLTIFDLSSNTNVDPINGYDLSLITLQSVTGFQNNYFKDVNTLIIRKSTDSNHASITQNKNNNNNNVQLTFNNKNIVADISYRIDFYYYNKSDLEDKGIRTVSRIKQLVRALQPQQIGSENIQLLNTQNYTTGVSFGHYNITSDPSFDISWSFPTSYNDYSGNIDIILFDISYSNNNSRELFPNQQFSSDISIISYTPDSIPVNQNSYSFTLTNLKYGNVYDIQIKATNLLNPNSQDFSTIFSSFQYFTNVPQHPTFLNTSNDVNINSNNNLNFINTRFSNINSQFTTRSLTNESSFNSISNILLNINNINNIIDFDSSFYDNTNLNSFSITNIINNFPTSSKQITVTIEFSFNIYNSENSIIHNISNENIQNINNSNQSSTTFYSNDISFNYAINDYYYLNNELSKRDMWFDNSLSNIQFDFTGIKNYIDRDDLSNIQILFNFNINMLFDNSNYSIINSSPFYLDDLDGNPYFITTGIYYNNNYKCITINQPSDLSYVCGVPSITTSSRINFLMGVGKIISYKFINFPGDNKISQIESNLFNSNIENIINVLDFTNSILKIDQVIGSSTISNKNLVDLSSTSRQFDLSNSSSNIFKPNLNIIDKLSSQFNITYTAYNVNGNTTENIDISLTEIYRDNASLTNILFNKRYQPNSNIGSIDFSNLLTTTSSTLLSSTSISDFSNTQTLKHWEVLLYNGRFTTIIDDYTTVKSIQTNHEPSNKWLLFRLDLTNPTDNPTDNPNTLYLTFNNVTTTFHPFDATSLDIFILLYDIDNNNYKFYNCFIQNGVADPVNSLTGCKNTLKIEGSSYRFDIAMQNGDNFNINNNRQTYLLINIKQNKQISFQDISYTIPPTPSSP